MVLHRTYMAQSYLLPVRWSVAHMGFLGMFPHRGSGVDFYSHYHLNASVNNQPTKNSIYTISIVYFSETHRLRNVVCERKNFAFQPLIKIALLVETFQQRREPGSPHL